MNIRPDNINFLSTLPNYINIGNPTGNIVISGSILDGNGQIFSTNISTSSSNTRFDIYGLNTNTNTKQLFSGTDFPSIYQFISTENVTLSTVYNTGSISVSIEVDNFTGSTINLVNQTIAVTIVEYEIPL